MGVGIWVWGKLKPGMQKEMHGVRGKLCHVPMCSLVFWKILFISNFFGMGKNG